MGIPYVGISGSACTAVCVPMSAPIMCLCLSHIHPFSRDDFNIKVLQAFVELHEFADLNLVQALR